MAKGQLTDDDRKKIVALYRDGISAPEIARRCGFGLAVIYYTLKKAKQERRPAHVAPVLSADQIAMLPVLYEKHGSLNKVAEAMGVSLTTVHRYLERQNHDRRPRGAVPIGDDKRNEVRRLYAELRSYAKVKQRTGFAIGTIMRIVKENLAPGNSQ